MAAPNLSTFDLTPPRRPTIADFNNASKQDDSAYPPNIVTMPNAAEYNTLCFLIVAIGQVIPTARVAVTAGSSPVVSSVIAPGSAVNSNTGAFTITRVAAGQYWVECTTAGLLPNTSSQPRVDLNGSTAATAEATYGTGPAFDNPAIYVQTWVSGTLIDVNFTVDFY